MQIGIDYIDKILAAHPDMDPKKLLMEIGRVIQHYSTHASKHVAGPPAERFGLVTMFHKMVDESVRGLNPSVLKDVKCKKGCAFCCHIKVEVSFAEAQFLYEICKLNDIPLDVDYLKQQAKLMATADFKMNKFSKCVFLGDDNACKVYDHRPMSCRAYMVVSDPKHCDYSGGSKEVQSVAAVEAHCMAAALCDADLAFGSMAEMLLKAIELDKLSDLGRDLFSNEYGDQY